MRFWLILLTALSLSISSLGCSTDDPSFDELYDEIVDCLRKGHYGVHPVPNSQEILKVSSDPVFRKLVFQMDNTYSEFLLYKMDLLCTLPIELRTKEVVTQLLNGVNHKTPCFVVAQIFEQFIKSTNGL